MAASALFQAHLKRAFKDYYPNHIELIYCLFSFKIMQAVIYNQQVWRMSGADFD